MIEKKSEVPSESESQPALIFQEESAVSATLPDYSDTDSSSSHESDADQVEFYIREPTESEMDTLNDFPGVFNRVKRIMNEIENLGIQDQDPVPPAYQYDMNIFRLVMKTLTKYDELNAGRSSMPGNFRYKMVKEMVERRDFNFLIDFVVFELEMTFEDTGVFRQHFASSNFQPMNVSNPPAAPPDDSDDESIPELVGLDVTREDLIG